MWGLLNPSVLGIIFFAVVTGSGASYLYGHHKGFEEASTQYELKASKALIESQLAVSATEHRMQIDTHNLAVAYGKEIIDAHNQVESLRAALRTGDVRLSIPVARCPSSEDATNSPAAPGALPQARAELLPATADDLVTLAAEADATARRLNAVIDQYNLIRNATLKE